MTIFDGYAVAEKKEAELKLRVAELRNQGVEPKIAAVLFREDAGSRLYTRLKREAAERVGIGYEVTDFSLEDQVEQIQSHIEDLNKDDSVTGIIIQKPWRLTWVEARGLEGESRQEQRRLYGEWWQSLTQALEESKDVDGLHPATLAAIQEGKREKLGKVLPATAKAVLDIMGEAQVSKQDKILILGKTDILGLPLYFELKNQGYDVENMGSKGLRERIESGQALLDADVVVSATGRKHLVTGEMVGEGVVVIDVGEPQPDVDFESVSKKARFITPVPGGVGPMTVVSLLESCVELDRK